MEPKGFYEGRPCAVCGGTTRRRGNRNCAACHKDRMRRYFGKGGPGYEAKQGRIKALRMAQKEAVFSHYGKRCALCGFADERALSIDHINQNGSERINPAGYKYEGDRLYRWLANNGFPADSELCAPIVRQ